MFASGSMAYPAHSHTPSIMCAGDAPFDCVLHITAFPHRPTDNSLSCIFHLHPSSMSPSDLGFHRVVAVSNDLNSLIEVGTLNFHSLPTQFLALQGIPADDDGWKWLDIDFLLQGHQGSVHPVFKAVVFLVRHRYFSATFKVFQVFVSELQPPFPVCKIRLYGIPLDVDGSRFLKLWRTQWLAQFLSRRFRSEWTALLKVVDFSLQSWLGPPGLHCSLLQFVSSNPVLLLPFAGTESFHDGFQSRSSFHFGRWLDQLPYHIPLLGMHEESLEVVLKRIYNTVDVPDLARYETISTPKRAQIPTPEEVIASLVKEYPMNRGLLPGVVSTLYPFQLKSLCKMFEKETVVRNVPVPYFKKLTSPTGRTYYFDMLDPGFYENAQLYTTPRGGILAENMGLGKTLICLSLLCLTKFDVSTVPHDLILYHDQSMDIGGPIDLTTAPHARRSLKDICRDTINQNSLPWKFYEEDLPESVVDLLSASPGYFRISLENSTSQLGLRAGDKRRPEQMYQTLYLCNTTLLIVPENLFHQWNHELAKHIDPSYLNKLFVSDRFKRPIHTNYSTYIDKLPESPRELLAYDLVLITGPLLAKLFKTEMANNLKEIYWKRLIIDEGHSMNSKSSNLSVLCSALYAERRWAVTGTPTSGLTNLHMDEEEQTQTTSVEESPSKKKRKYVVKSKFNVRDDLVKLGNLVGTFFKIEPFHSQPKLWNSAIVRNLCDSTFSTEDNLKSLLDSLIVRHNLSDVEGDLRLPQLHHEAIFLSPSYHNKLSVNLFAAVLAVNAVSSEREGSDYMFDPSNRQQLRRLVNNLQLATFYWTGFQHEDVNTLISIAKHCMEKKNTSGEPYHGEHDQALLRRSLAAAHEAVNNRRWRTASLIHEMQYFVDGLPPGFAKHFGIGVLQNSDLGVFGAPQLAAIQDFYYKNRFLDFGDVEKLDSRLENASRQFWETYWNDSTRKANTKFKKQESSHDFDVHGLKQSLNDDVVETSFTISPSRRLSSASQDWTSTKDSLRRENHGEFRLDDRVVGNGSQRPNLQVKEAEILGCASAKLAYLSSRLEDHQKEGIKSIVFFEFEDSAYYLTELLDILGVHYILYATFIGAGQRSNNLADFDSHDSNTGGMTLIMDLRLASHGLTIISATRVYFMSPVWQRSVEAQAIKRAHRIGQTREVFVETLVLRGTLEEEIYRRREQDDVQQEKSDSSRQYVIDDTGMQQFILKHEFLPTHESEVEYSDFSALDLSNGTETSSKQLDDISDSLLSHESRCQLRQQHWYRTWTMHLFNPDNLEKLNATKRQKANIDQLNSELVEGKPQTSMAVGHLPKKRKTVRF